MAFELWSSDLFDREAEPRLELKADTLRDGLLALWRKTLEEGVDDQGRPTFTAFTLRGARLRLSLPRDPSKNPQLAELRWRLGENDFLWRVVTLHEPLAREPFSFEPYLAIPVQLPREVETCVRTLANALGLTRPLRTTARHAWSTGEPTKTHLTVTSEATRWRVEVRGAAGVRFAVQLEDIEWAGWRCEVQADESTGAQTLGDALLAAGVSFSRRVNGDAR